MNAVAFSLWGSLSMYCQGAIRNAELMPKIYPGWKMVVYADGTVPEEVTLNLARLGTTIRKPTCSNGMFWRFHAADGETFERVIFRDTDSRISERESAAVKEWIESGRTAHVIADHPHHTLPIGGGLWGIKGKLEMVFAPIHIKCERSVNYNSDQIWLRDYVWPMVKNDVLIHDFCYHRMRRGARPFPAKFGDNRFVGEVFNADDTPRSFDSSMRLNWMEP